MVDGGAARGGGGAAERGEAVRADAVEMLVKVEVGSSEGGGGRPEGRFRC